MAIFLARLGEALRSRSGLEGRELRVRGCCSRRRPGVSPPARHPALRGPCRSREDMYSQDSIDLLANSGLQFQKHEEEGIDTLHFAELLMTSGVVLCDNVKWLSFHSGYDFGYMVKLLTDSRLPEEEHEFFHILNLFFPSIYDVKYLMKSCKNLKGGLQEVADQLDLQRIGRQHQAGSDSLLTGMAFFRMKELFFEDSIDDAKYCGRLYGLGTGVAQKQNEDVDSAQEKMSILAIINNMQQ
ncbi:CCR4-NOT transcription complex subunit 8 isoform X2 [Trachypithecus francoisi]|uniref:CCR4-NOT transcription complex subunit 8 isoform X2 n=1 Tax=Trachypithecus francoisi TaxID=54180 RepID=UPI00141B12CC|nr:CCR4-NOT transcription complex subunit 8 isoform X2 [Trachypithecus francoisi]